MRFVALFLLLLLFATRRTFAFSSGNADLRFGVVANKNPIIASRMANNNNNNNDNTEQQAGADDDKFSFGQRIESIKCVVVGAVSGGVSVVPFTLIHDTLLNQGLVSNGLAQFEFDTDMGSLEAALFAIVYRYCIRTDTNPMLNQGVLGAFVIVRTLSRIQVPSYCSAVPLECGAPLGYFDWSMVGQGLLSGAESIALFGGAAFAMEWCFRRGYISKFP